MKKFILLLFTFLAFSSITASAGQQLWFFMVASGSAPGGIDWSSWDGSNDGAVTARFPGGSIALNTEKAVPAAISDDELVIFYQEHVGTPAPKAVVIDIDTGDNTFKAETTNTILTLQAGNSESGSIVKLTDTRLIVGYLDKGPSPDQYKFHVISKSGKTLADLDDASTTEGTAVQENFGLVRLNDTQAVGTYAIGLTDGQVKLRVIDAASDTATLGAVLNIGVVDFNNFPSVARATDTEFFATDEQQIHFCSVSGTTITNEGTLDILSGGADIIDTAAVRISDTSAIVVYQKAAADNKSFANTFTWSGSAITRGTEKEIIASDLIAYSGTAPINEIGNSQAFFVGRMTDLSSHTHVVVLSTDGTDITVEQSRQRSTSVTTLNPAISMAPSGDFAFLTFRIGSGDDLGELGTRVLVNP